jgi:hypothetical protein
MCRRRDLAVQAKADLVTDWRRENFDEAKKGSIYAVDMHEDPDVVMSTHGIALVKV